MLRDVAVKAAELSKVVSNVVSASEGAVNAAEVSNIVVDLYHLRNENLNNLCSILRLETLKLLQKNSNGYRGDERFVRMKKLNSVQEV